MTDGYLSMKLKKIKSENILPVVMIGITLVALLIFSEIIWWKNDKSYLMKGSGESYAIYLAAYNITDFKSLILQDLAASPDSEAHPYFYIHHPNLPPKIISYVFQLMGVHLEWQIAIMLLFGVLGLLVLAGAIFSISPWGAFFAIFIAATSWGGFHFNAGDLLRGPTYLILWTTIFALLRNEFLDKKKYNYLILIMIILSVLSDWGFALFLFTLIYCYSRLSKSESSNIWFVKFALIPGVAAFLFYSFVIISVVGLEFYIFDIKITYFSRIGNINSIPLSEVLSKYRDNNVVVWTNLSSTHFNVNELIRTIFIQFGSAFNGLSMALKVALVCSIIMCLVNEDLGVWWWSTLLILIYLNFSFGAPLIILIGHVAWAVKNIKKIKIETNLQLISALNYIIFLALILTGITLPGYSINFLYIGERSPMPILLIFSATLLSHFLLRSYEYRKT